MIGRFGLLFGIVWTYDQRVSWQIGLIIILTSLASLYLAFTHARFKNWIAFGGHVRVRSFSGIKTYDWREVVSISYEFNMETGREAVRRTVLSSRGSPILSMRVGQNGNPG